MTLLEGKTLLVTGVLTDRSVLSRITAPTLVVGQEADPLHPIALARELTSLLPNASLLELPEGGVFWTDAVRVQTALADHLEDS